MPLENPQPQEKPSTKINPLIAAATIFLGGATIAYFGFGVSPNPALFALISSTFGATFLYQSNRNALINEIEHYDVEAVRGLKFIFLEREPQLNVDIENAKYPKLLEELLKTKISVNFRDKNGKTPLMHYAANFDEHNAKKLLARKPNLLARDNKQNSVLHHAIMAGNFEMVQILVPPKTAKESVNPKVAELVNLQNIDGNSALMLCPLYKEHNIAKYLMANGGADLSLKNHQDQTMEMIAQEVGYKPLMPKKTSDKSAKQEEELRIAQEKAAQELAEKNAAEEIKRVEEEDRKARENAKKREKQKLEKERIAQVAKLEAEKKLRDKEEYEKQKAAKLEAAKQKAAEEKKAQEIQEILLKQEKLKKEAEEKANQERRKAEELEIKLRKEAEEKQRKELAAIKLKQEKEAKAEAEKKRLEEASLAREQEKIRLQEIQKEKQEQERLQKEAAQKEREEREREETRQRILQNAKEQQERRLALQAEIEKKSQEPKPIIAPLASNLKEARDQVEDFLYHKTQTLTSNEVSEINFKGSYLYHFFLEAPLDPSDIDLEIKVSGLKDLQNPKIAEKLCELFSVKNRETLKDFLIWRGEFDDPNKDARNAEFKLAPEFTGLPLSLNVVLRDEKYPNPTKKDWVASFDGFRIGLKPQTDLTLCDDLREYCSNVETLVDELTQGLVRINPHNCHAKTLSKYSAKNLISGDIETIITAAKKTLSDSETKAPSPSPKLTENEIDRSRIEYLTSGKYGQLKTPEGAQEI